MPVPALRQAIPFLGRPGHHVGFSHGDPILAPRADVHLLSRGARDAAHEEGAPLVSHAGLRGRHATQGTRRVRAAATGHGLIQSRPIAPLRATSNTLPNVAQAAADLRALIASRHQLILAQTRDESALMAAVTEAGRQLQLPLWQWTPAAGLSVPGTPAQTNTRSPDQALTFLRDLGRTALVTLLDAGQIMTDPVAVRLLKDLATTRGGPTLVVTGLGPAVPEELEGVAISWVLPPPDRAEMAAVVRRLSVTLPRMGLRMEVADPNRLVDAVLGLTPAEAERVLLQQAVVDGRLDDSDAVAAQRARAELLSEGPLDLVDPDVTFDDVAGLMALKAWLRQRARGFEPAAREFGLDAPRGVLLTGVPGCGKSLIARAIAGSWGMALAALDVGRLHGSLVGESESRMRQALTAAEAMAPAVLWVDEIEKAFSGGEQNDGGVSQRVLGVLLRWLQERADGVFVVATSNDVTALPPEVTRRGRFDELFFVDLPDPLERQAVIAHHLTARRRDPARYDLATLAAAAEGFSGAEIESAVTSALYEAYSRGVDVDTAGLAAEFAATVPLSVTRAEDIARLRQWAVGRARPAGGSPPPLTAPVAP